MWACILYEFVNAYMSGQALYQLRHLLRLRQSPFLELIPLIHSSEILRS